jgi:hypothetical protein
LRHDVLGVLADAAEERRAEAILVAHADEGEAGQALHDAAPVQGIAVEAERRELDPAEARPEAGAPDDRGEAVAHGGRSADAL